MNHTINLHIIALLALSLAACNNQSRPSSSLEEDEAKIRRIHEQSREFHFNKNAGGMVEQFSENMVSVNGGKVSVASKKADAAGFQQYFDAVKFIKWDDLKPPIIRFSADRSLAYVIVDKIVVLETKDTTGAVVEATTHYAWVSIFRKQTDGEYKLDCIASTNEPEQVRKL